MINKNPSNKDIFWFGAGLPVLFAILGFLARAEAGESAAYAIWGIGAAVSLIYVAAWPLRRPVYVGWLYLTYPIGWVITHVLLVVIYLAVVTPVGLLVRFISGDPLERRPDPAASTYWVEHEGAQDPETYLRQF